MRNAASLEIYDYWNELRGSRDAPSRSDIDPMQVRSILPDLFMLKDEGGSVLRFGLTGTRLYNLFQRELGGSDFDCIWHVDVAGYACDIARGVMEHRLPVIFELQGKATDEGGVPTSMEMVLLPLNHEHSSRRLLGCISCEPARGDFSRPLSPLAIVRSNLLHPFQPRKPDGPLANYAPTISK